MADETFGSLAGPVSDRFPVSDPHPERQFQALVQQIVEHGHWEDGRNGRTKGIFGHTMRYPLTDGQLPLFTTKRTAWKTCLKELLWFIRGQTDNRVLQAQGVHIWDANASPEFLASRGLAHCYADGLLGPIYGFQWRHFHGLYDGQTGGIVDDLDINPRQEQGVDQLQQLVTALKDPAQRNSRRLLLSAWNPAQLHLMALPPCHVMCQFRVTQGNRLSCALFQRSCDVALGLSFNVASYSFLTHLLAHHCGLVAHELVHFIGDAHLYEDHVEPVQQVLLRDPLPLPRLRFSASRERLEDYEVADFVVEGYQSHEAIVMQMVA